MHTRLSKERSHKINKLYNEKEGIFIERSHKMNKLYNEKKGIFIERSSKLEHKYKLVVRLKAIKYRKNFLHYLISYLYYQASFQVFLFSLSQDIIFPSRFSIY